MEHWTIICYYSITSIHNGRSASTSVGLKLKTIIKHPAVINFFEFISYSRFLLVSAFFFDRRRWTAGCCECHEQRENCNKNKNQFHIVFKLVVTKRNNTEEWVAEPASARIYTHIWTSNIFLLILMHFCSLWFWQFRPVLPWREKKATRWHYIGELGQSTSSLHFITQYSADI